MSLAAAVLRHLNSNHIAFRECTHARSTNLNEAAQACGVASFELARTLLLRDGAGFVLAVLPLNRVPDFAKLSAWLHRDLRPVAGPEADRLFPDCAPHCHPPFGEPYGLSTIVDRTLLDLPQVYFEPGCPSSLVRVAGRDFQFLCGRAARGDFTQALVPPAVGAPAFDLEKLAQTSNYQLPSEEEIRRRLEQVYRLPAMPAVAARILSLVADPMCTAKQLAELIEMDPSLAAQVIRYARSSFFGYRGSVDSIQIAITRVLGFDIVYNLAVGIAAGRVFRLPGEGPLGLNAFWRHAVYTAALAQTLARHMPESLGVKPGTAYLAGLLHNFGILLLGHMFPPEYAFLNKLVAAYPDLPLPVIERRLLGMGGAQKLISLGHAQMGARLMHHWNLPAEVVAATEHHHDADYQGACAPYVQLINLVNAILARQGLGDEPGVPVRPEAVAGLGLTLAGVEAAAAQLFAGAEELDRLALLMVV